MRRKIIVAIIKTLCLYMACVAAIAALFGLHYVASLFLPPAAAIVAVSVLAGITPFVVYAFYDGGRW